MAKVEKLDNLLLVFDPATNSHMPFDERWTFNGDFEKPTFRPSMLCDYGFKGKTHCFVTDGKIQYLSDCTHSLVGQTIECVDIK